MLCKTTMRAALAHVLATVGILGAFGAGAAPDDPYAVESLSKAPTATNYAIKGSPMGEIVLDVEIDTLLESADNYYLVVNFWSAELTGECPAGPGCLPTTFAANAEHPDVGGTAGDTTAEENPLAQPTVGQGTGFRFYNITESTNNVGTTPGVAGEVTPANGSISGITLTRASGGAEDDSSGMYLMEIGANVTIGTRVRLELGSSLAVPNTGAGTYYGDLYIYDTRGDARAALRASSPSGAPNTHLVHDQQKLFEVKSTIAKPTVTPMLATADVGYERTPTVDAKDNTTVSNGGPFRGFEPRTGVTGSANNGLLAMIELNAITDSNPGKPGDQGFLAASNGMAYKGTPNTGASVKVTAMAGAFGFGDGAGTGLNEGLTGGEEKIVGDNPGTDDVEDDFVLNAGGAPRAFRIATNGDSCSGGTHLVLSAPSADDPTKQATINPTADNPTFSAAATQGNATVTGEGPFYLCVNVGANEVPIPAVGDDRDLNGYKITVTPMHGKTASSMVTADAAGGSIDRNGATINITYLSLDPSYNQRLVIVNRSGREAGFWMDNFQTEEGTEIMGEIRGTVGSMSRMVIDVQNELSNNAGGQDRASGTLNLTAPTGNIDVMTVQVHPDTDQIDTTLC
ncbi:MAG: hypothetical protein OXG44_06150 [Gammaproteobacteria bacterium]|nr:hypothetical protein [Gammaproteobacteria bacterium]